MLHKGRLFLTIKTFPFPFFGKVSLYDLRLNSKTRNHLFLFV
jgi:hypothetical protein